MVHVFAHPETRPQLDAGEGRQSWGELAEPYNKTDCRATQQCHSTAPLNSATQQIHSRATHNVATCDMVLKNENASATSKRKAQDYLDLFLDNTEPPPSTTEPPSAGATKMQPPAGTAKTRPPAVAT
mmetsp:Transcript_7199/g.18329  ORF Transcript_7199/g.18329 Transcript_7199/m.18329 type:complete len:127 (+) Transcript_7199:772-1152(+)